MEARWEEERAGVSQWRWETFFYGCYCISASATGRMALEKVAYLRWGSPLKILCCDTAPVKTSLSLKLYWMESGRCLKP